MLIEKVLDIMIFDGETWVTVTTRFIRDILTQEAIAVAEEPTHE